ncbi:hypothetical protein KQI82_01880 [Oscillibacter sp. MSJ-2]|uniref:Uncharacterized protein n=1 Tax=Dysosmobacter acutus TaxID=2841504 RepID=A0ABS6F5W0_9FIRM|nr:hypothetical protein [Dysosmobacter acutus]MBU5625684.1 hypothetical protein [Dysosmobacter acutus]
MSYYRKCPECGAALDPGEKCDCELEPRGNPEKNALEPRGNKEKTAPDGANIKGGREVEQTDSASNYNGR